MKIFQFFLVLLIGLSVNSIRKENSNIIYIDPGHGGSDGGCVGIDGTKEKDINLKISLYVRENLEKLGYVVKLTRTGDYDLSSDNSINHKREDMINRCNLLNNGILFVSIHSNEYYDKSVNGAQVFYGNKQSERLALNIQKVLEEMIGTKRNAMEIEEKFLLTNTSTVGCIVEVGFLSNVKELKLLNTQDYQEKIAYAISIGIANYLA